MFLSSRNNQFRFEFPRKFIPDHIADKYRAFVNRIPGGMIKEPIDLFNYGVQSINLPGPSFDPVSQNDFPGFTRNFRDAKPTQELFDKNLTVTMQSFDGFINYWMAVEIFQYYYSQSGKQPWIPDGVGLQLMDGEGNLFMTCQLQEMIMTGVGALDLNFSSNTVDFQTFDITFVYNVLEIKSIATEKVRAVPISTSPAPVCLPAQILLNGDKVLDAQSGVRTDIRVLQDGQAVGAWNGQALIIPPCEPAEWQLENEVGGILGTGQIESGGSGIIVAPDGTVLRDGLPFGSVLSGGTIDVPSAVTPCADATVELNGVEMATIPSGDTENIEVRQSTGSTLVGSQQGQYWRIGDSEISINGTPIEDVQAEDSLDIPVIQDGSPAGSWNGTQWVIPSCPAGGGSISVAVSDATPDVGDTITITATATGFTPTDYYFYAKQGTELLNIGSSVSGVINWTVTPVGAIDIFAQAHDNTASAFNIGGELVTGVAAVITANLQLWLDPFRSNIVAPSYPDLSGFSRNGTLVNTPTVVVGSLAANNGGYIQLNGVNQYIGSIGTVADFAFVQNTRVFSMGGFFYIGSTTTYNPLIASSVTSAKKGFGLVYAGDTSQQIQVDLYSGVLGNILSLISNNNAVTSVGWYHIYVTYTGVGGVAQIYLNGSPITTTVTGSASIPTGNSTDPLRIGSESLNIFFMNGRIGPVQIYNTALTQAQVQLNFNADRARYGL